MTDNLPTVADGRDLALAGEATDDGGIVSALQTLMAGLSDRAQAFDDINVSLHVDRAADGASRSCFTYRACKSRR
jgi:hypothetical protein